jgi:type III restriction enzyme
VLITVANRTETAARVKYAFDHRKVLIGELCDPDRTLHIDSRELEKAEAAEEPVAAAETGGAEEGKENAAGNGQMTKQQRAELLRRTVDTVGQRGQPGEQIQNVISVGMLSEGWDSKTVTHIMGLRAFTSQLLCEQVVGRGLRRTTYELKKTTHPVTGEPTELFEPEHVNIFGVLFTFLPHEGGDGPPPPPSPPKNRDRAGR